MTEPLIIGHNFNITNLVDDCLKFDLSKLDKVDKDKFKIYKPLMRFVNKLNYLKDVMKQIKIIKTNIKIELPINNLITHSLGVSDSFAGYDFFNMKVCVNANKCSCEDKYDSHVSMNVLAENISRIISLENPTLAQIVFEEVNQEKPYRENYKKQKKAITKRYADFDKEARDLGLDLTKLRNDISIKYDVAIVDLVYSTIPLFFFGGLIQAEIGLKEYFLEENVAITANIGYNPKQHMAYRCESLKEFEQNNGRTVKQRLLDKTTKKVDGNVIDTLRSIAQYDPYENIVKIADRMMRNYELADTFDIRKKLVRSAR